MSVNGKNSNLYNLYSITNNIRAVLRANITRETNNFLSIKQRKNSSAEETLKKRIIKAKALVNT